MTDNSALLDKINKKEMEIQSLEDRLKGARIYVQALRDAVALLNDTPEDTGGMGEVTLRVGSTAAMVRDAIVRANRPMHADELLEYLGRPPGRETRQSLVSAIANYVRKGEIFTRPAPNTFGLLSLGHDELPPPDEPPEDFGTE